MKILVLALNSFRNAIRQKILILFMLIAIGLIVLSRFVMGLNIALGQMDFVADFGSGALSFFGVIIAIVATSQLMHSEYDNKSVNLILSKAVSPLEFVVAKFLGIGLLLFIYSLVISILTILLLYYTQYSLEDVPDLLIKGGRKELSLCGFLAYTFLEYLKICIVASLTLLVCCVSKAILFSIVISACVYMICILSSSSLFDISSAFMYNFASNIFPDLGVFDSAKNFIFNGVDFALFGYGIAYAFAYMFIILLVSAFIFSRREF
ncbi:MAG: ABC transporter permease [Opitutales bacterium]